MNDYINKVHKIITDGNTTTFIIQTEGDSDFWFWQVDNTDIRNYFRTHKSAGTTLVIALNGHLTPTAANIFANDLDNTDKGTSCGGYDTIEDILREFNIIK